jgi:hypothetical protein
MRCRNADPGRSVRSSLACGVRWSRIANPTHVGAAHLSRFGELQTHTAIQGPFRRVLSVGGREVTAPIGVAVIVSTSPERPLA